MGLFGEERSCNMRYFLHPNVCNRVTLAQATPSGQEGPSLWGYGSQVHFPENNARGLRLAISLGQLWSGWVAGRTHFTFEFCPETAGGSAQGRANSNWWQGHGVCPGDIHVPVCYTVPWSLQRRRLQSGDKTENRIAREEKEIVDFRTKGILSLVSWQSIIGTPGGQVTAQRSSKP